MSLKLACVNMDLLRCFIFIISPVLISASINLNITKNGTEKIDITGQETSVINENDIELFRIQEDILKDCVENYLGGRPDDIYTHKPTPWSLYETYKWPEITKTVTPNLNAIASNKTTKVLLQWENVKNIKYETSIYTVQFKFSFQNNVSTHWGETFHETIYNKMAVNILDLKETRGPTVWNFTLKSDELDKNYTIFTNSDPIFEILDPGQNVTLELFGYKKKMAFIIDFDVSLSGNLVINYENAFRGHHFYSSNIENVLDDCNMRYSMKFTQFIELEYFEKLEVTSRDGESRSVLGNVVIDPLFKGLVTIEATLNN